VDLGNRLDIAGQDFTIEYWFNAPNANQLAPLISKRQGSGSFNQYQAGIGYVDSGGSGVTSKKIYFFGYDGTNLQGVHTTNDVVDGNWHYVAITRTGAGFKIYVDGVSAALTIDTAGIPSESYANTGSLSLASDGANFFFNGQVDEVRVSSGVARSADWILTQYRNQSAPATYLSTGGQTAPGAYANGYSYCKVVTTSHAIVSGAGDLANFPLTVSLTDADLMTTANGGLVTNSSGYDIGFYPDCSGTGAALKWEIESYTPATGALVAHVLRPALSHTADDTIGMYYGGAFSSFQSTAPAVWDSNFQGVWHFPNGSTLSSADSTGVNNGTNNAATATVGKMDGGAGFDGVATNKIATAYAAALGNFTISVWFKSTGVGTGGYDRIVDKSYVDGLVMSRIGNAPNTWGVYFEDPAAASPLSVTLADGAWHHLAVTRSGTTLALLGDGGAVSATKTVAATATSTAALAIGYFPNAGSPFNMFMGAIDEVRVSNVARSPDWLVTEYRNQSAPATYLSLGPRLSGTLRRVRHSVKTDQ
jgi:hypothetical protein